MCRRSPDSNMSYFHRPSLSQLQLALRGCTENLSYYQEYRALRCVRAADPLRSNPVEAKAQVQLDCHSSNWCRVQAMFRCYLRELSARTCRKSITREVCSRMDLKVCIFCAGGCKMKPALTQLLQLMDSTQKARMSMISIPQLLCLSVSRNTVPLIRAHILR